MKSASTETRIPMDEHSFDRFFEDLKEFTTEQILTELEAIGDTVVNPENAEDLKYREHILRLELARRELKSELEEKDGERMVERFTWVATLAAVILGGYTFLKSEDHASLNQELKKEKPNALILKVLREKGWRQMTQDELIHLQIERDTSEGGISVEEWLERARAKIIEGNKN